jgi:hypothetical protein
MPCDQNTTRLTFLLKKTLNLCTVPHYSFFPPHDVRLFDVLSAKRRERHRRPVGHATTLVFPTILLRGAAIKFCRKGKHFVAHNSFDLTILDGWPKASFIWYIFQLHLGPYVMMKSLTRICHFMAIYRTKMFPSH